MRVDSSMQVCGFLASRLQPSPSAPAPQAGLGAGQALFEVGEQGFDLASGAL